MFLHKNWSVSVEVSGLCVSSSGWPSDFDHDLTKDKGTVGAYYSLNMLFNFLVPGYPVVDALGPRWVLGVDKNISYWFPTSYR